MSEELHADTVDGIVAAVAALRSTGLGCDVALVLVQVERMRRTAVPMTPDIARALAMPKSTVWRHVVTLMERGFVRTGQLPKLRHHEVWLTPSGEAAAAKAAREIVAAFIGPEVSLAA